MTDSAAIGRTILITRAPHQADELVQLVKANGMIPVLFPLIDIVPPPTWEQCDAAIESLYMYDGVVFTSANAVAKFIGRMQEISASVGELNSKRIIAVGTKTGEMLERAGVAVTEIPESFTSVDLGRMLAHEDLRDRTFLFPHGNLTDNNLSGALKLLGATVDRVIVYQTKPHRPANTDDVKNMIATGTIDVITFTSPSTVVNFCALYLPHEIPTVEAQTHFAVIGPTTAVAARSAGLEVNIVANEATSSSLVEAIQQFFGSTLRSGPNAHPTPQAIVHR